MIGSFVLRQHVVEFIRGVGVVTDGVADGTSLNGPWDWPVPDDVAELTVDACGAGSAGGPGGYVASMLSAGGGQSGAAGAQIFNAKVSVRPKSTLTISLGAAGTFRTAGTGTGPSGGYTQISGVLSGYTWEIPGTISMRGGAQSPVWQASEATAAASTGARGGGTATLSLAHVATSGENAWGNTLVLGSAIQWQRTNQYGRPGGAGNDSATPGFNGASVYFSYTVMPNNYRSTTNTRYGMGTYSGGVSRGGGSEGEPTIFGLGGAGGTDADGQAAEGYGAGGGGGAGGYGGGAGGEGYVRFTFWSARV